MLGKKTSIQMKNEPSFPHFMMGKNVAFECKFIIDFGMGGGGYFHFATVLFTQNCRAIHFVFD